MGKKAIVIGGSSGLGRELVKVLSQKGYRVAVTARRFGKLQDLAGECAASVGRLALVSM